MSKVDDVIAQRADERRRTAEAAAARVLDALHAKGIDMRLFGSLVRGGFKDHSDVDFLVRGLITPAVRVAVKSKIARVLGATDLPYDVIYLDDDLYAQLVELKSFRHLVRHQYGIDLDPDKTSSTASRRRTAASNAASAAFMRGRRRIGTTCR